MKNKKFKIEKREGIKQNLNKRDRKKVLRIINFLFRATTTKKLT